MRATGLAVGVFAAMVTLAGVSFGQSKGFALNRFDPSERGSDWFSTESLDLRGSNRLAVGLVADWAHKPLVYYFPNGDEASVVVSNQLFAHLGASYVLFDRLRIGLNVPVALVNTGEDDAVGSVSLNTGAAIGDVRVGADVRLLGQYGDVFTAAFGLQVHIPSGSQEAFTGDGKPRLVPRLLGAGTIGGFVYSARIGPNIRFQTDKFEGDPFGTELVFGAAAGASLVDDKLVVGPEVYGSTVLLDGGAFKRKTTPFEVIIGGHYKVTDSWRVGLGVGPGLTRGYGAPKLRVLASVEWVSGLEEPPPPPRSDRDHDGIFDEDDACPDVAGVPSDDPTKHGCPLPLDRDGDGIIDIEDACPDDPGPPSDDPAKHGCPLPADRDGDGIIDAEDACPDDPGPPNEDPKKHGCPPPPDRDGDGIIDAEDACPDNAGPANEDPKKHGCPMAVVTEKEIKIMDRVEFDTGKATIRPESNGVLNAVLAILQQNPNIRLLSVEGHTDNRGVVGANLKLSKDRAAAVVKWLISHGIAKERLTSQGFGQTKPIDTNDTDGGRQNNRRVEFQILERTAQQ